MSLWRTLLFQALQVYYLSDVDGVLCEEGVWIGVGGLFELHRALVLEEIDRADVRHTEFLP